jgi:hypothetical protein
MFSTSTYPPYFSTTSDPSIPFLPFFLYSLSQLAAISSTKGTSTGRVPLHGEGKNKFQEGGTQGWAQESKGSCPCCLEFTASLYAHFKLPMKRGRKRGRSCSKPPPELHLAPHCSQPLPT